MYVPHWRKRTALIAGCLASVLNFTGLAFGATPPPAPPASPLSELVRRLAEKKSAQTPTKISTEKSALLLPEFRFKPADSWLLLPDLARQLSSNETEREAVLNLLEQGTQVLKQQLAAAGADNDIAAAAAFSLSQLWSFSRQHALAEADTDALHAQLVAVLKTPELAKLSDADKQRFWEYCVGFPVFVLGMREVATEPKAQEDLRAVAAAGFTAFLGLKPEQVEIGANGLAPSASAVVELEKLDRESSTTGTKSELRFSVPPGWARLEKEGTSVLQAVLSDLDANGRPDPQSERRHAAMIFVRPVLAAPQGGAALFETVWREQFAAFELGDAVVYYSSRLKSGLVVHYMGRFLDRRGAPDGGRVYGALHLVELGDRVQPIVTTLIPGTANHMPIASLNEDPAYSALVPSAAAFLNSIELGSGKAPRPSGGLFDAKQISGKWSSSSNSFGGMFVYAMSGTSAGAAGASSGTKLELRGNNTFSYAFAGHVSHPGYGGQTTVDNNDGRYALDGDVVRFDPRVPRDYRYDFCVVGAGAMRTPNGPRRILITVAADAQGVYRAPPLLPRGDSYEGSMTSYVEELPTK
jgi:hypothetical protein